jgi:hypothetical protein
VMCPRDRLRKSGAIPMLIATVAIATTIAIIR